MSLQSCQAGAITGFPLNPTTNIFTSTAADFKKITVPNDITVNWLNADTNVNINTHVSSSSLTITGLDAITANTTLTLGGVSYNASSVISIIKKQHAGFLSQNDQNAVSAECVQEFTIKDKALHPGSPDIVLIIRPLSLLTTSDSSMKVNSLLNAVNTSMISIDSNGIGTSQTITNFNLSSLYAYPTGELLPSINYQTCLPLNILNYSGSGTATQSGSLVVRVNFIISPIYIKVTAGTGLGKSSQIPSSYSLVSSSLQKYFTNVNSSASLQFSDGTPNQGNTLNLVFSPSSSGTSSVSIFNLIELAIPESLMGQPLSDLYNKNPPALPRSTSNQKQYKCYKIDPTKDIKNGQILVDPTTGESLSQAVADHTLGEDPDLLKALNGTDASGILPGDIEFGLSILATIIGTIVLLAYGGYIVHMFFYEKNLNGGLGHSVMFAILLFCLIVFSVFFDKKPS
jgi:hypothetical protein